MPALTIGNNPAKTEFLRRAEVYGTVIKNGLEMLYLGDVDKIQAAIPYNRVIFIYLHHFLDMGKKFAFFVVAKSQRKMVFV